MLWNEYNHEALDLSNGQWEYGQVQTWESDNEARTSEGQYNKRWMIAKIPGTDDYQIINSHYGVLIGGFAGERYGNWLVKAGPISTDGFCARWGAEDAGNGYLPLIVNLYHVALTAVASSVSRGGWTLVDALTLRVASRTAGH